jgi:hypothetical protein
MIVPAVGFGMFIVFGLGYGLIYALMEKIAHNRLSSGNALENVSTEKYIEHTSLIGGIFAVVMLIISLLVLPHGWVLAIWGTLTILGIIGGFLTFLLRKN